MAAANRLECSQEAFGGRTTGIGDADVDAAKLRGHCGDKAADGGCVGYIKGLRQNFRSVLLSIFSAAACSVCRLRAHIATRQPSAAKASAVASPSP